MEYKIEQLRNVVLLGHGSSGKTSLGEAMLFNAGAISRVGRVEDKNTVSDYDEEEQTRGFSVSSSVLPCEWKGRKLNIIDAPGYVDFVGEVTISIQATDGAVLVISAASGVEVGAELHWRYLDDTGRPRLIFVNKLDRENTDFRRVLEELGTKFEATFVPIQLPIGSGASFEGIIDLVSLKAYMGSSVTPVDIPANLQDAAEEARMEMMEYAAESDDELMMKYLDGEELSNEEIISALAQGSSAGSFVLVAVGSATQNVGIKPLLDAVVAFMPSPASIEQTVTNMATDEEMVLPPDPNGPLVVQVFKTLADPFVGKMTYFRVYSGVMKSDSRVYNVNTSEEERVAQIFFVRGKEQTTTDGVSAGDIGVVAKLAETGTGDTLCDRGEPYLMPPIVYPNPLFSAAVFPKTKADLDKLGSSLSRLVEEDQTLRVERSAETNETIISGMGESHIQIALRRLSQKFGVDVETELPKIAYRETITRSASAQGRHKKQSGGRGQFGDVHCRFEPLERGAGAEFASEIFGGSVPKSYIPAVEKGFFEALEEGVVAGYPTVDVRCVLYDGSYHAVDSSELAFKLATHLSFRAAVADARPVLLEPVYKIEVTVPESFMGDILGDLNTRRAQVQGMAQERGRGIVTALVPLAEIQRYATDLRAMTQGRGLFSIEFSHYDIVPAQEVENVKKAAELRAEREAERA